jgi:hypothetical protein
MFRIRLHFGWWSGSFKYDSFITLHVLSFEIISLLLCFNNSHVFYGSTAASSIRKMMVELLYYSSCVLGFWRHPQFAVPLGSWLLLSTRVWQSTSSTRCRLAHCEMALESHTRLDVCSLHRITDLHGKICSQPIVPVVRRGKI